MPLHFFTIPVLSTHHQAQDDLNRFVAAHRVLRLDRQLVQAGEHSCWAICVETQDGLGALPANLTAGGAGKARLDDQEYRREWQSPDDFAVFARLRAVAAWLIQAERDGVSETLLQRVYDATSAGVPEAQRLYFREQFRRRYAGRGDDAGPGFDS